MRIGVTIDGDPARIAEAEVRAAERAVTRAVNAAGVSLKSAWRRQITGAGLGQRLANTIRNRTYPNHGESIGAAALVWSKAPQIVGAHARGALIRSTRGLWLAIPTPAAEQTFRQGRLTPAIWERRTGLRLRFVYRPTGVSLLVADNVRLTRAGRIRENVRRSRGGGSTYAPLRGRSAAVVFLLVRQVRLRKRLDLDAGTRAAEAALPGRIAAEWVEQRI